MSTAGTTQPTPAAPSTATASTGGSVALAAMLAHTPSLLSQTAREVLRELQAARMSPNWDHRRRDWNLGHLISRIGTLMTVMHLRRMPDTASAAARCLVLLRLIHSPQDSAEQDAAWLKSREELACLFNPGWPDSVVMLATALGAALEEPIMRRVCAVDHLAELLLTTAKCWPTVPPPPFVDLSRRAA